MKGNLIPILSEDECAPDARDYFEKKFLAMMKVSRDDFIKIAERDPDHDDLVYRLGCYQLDLYADYQFWTLSIMTGGERSLIVTSTNGTTDCYHCHEEAERALQDYNSCLSMGNDVVSVSLVIKSTDYEPFSPIL